MGTQIQQNRYDQLLRRIADLKGPGSKVSEVLTELFPVLDVERVPAELLAAMGTRLAWGRVISPAVAARFSRCQLFNPIGSGKLVTITSIGLRSDTNQIVELGLLAVALANQSAVGGHRDGRFQLVTGVTAQLRADDNAAVSPAIYRLTATTLPVGFFTDSNDIAVLPPGVGLVASAVTANTSLTCSFLWRERQGEPSELSI